MTSSPRPGPTSSGSTSRSSTSSERSRRQGYTLVLGSNTNDLHAAHFRRQFADALAHFDRLVLSYEVGHIKPSAAFYHACVEAAGARPDECVFIDDLPENVEGAAPPGSSALDLPRYPHPTGRPPRLGVEIDARELTRRPRGDIVQQAHRPVVADAQARAAACSSQTMNPLLGMEIEQVERTLDLRASRHEDRRRAGAGRTCESESSCNPEARTRPPAARSDIAGGADLERGRSRSCLWPAPAEGREHPQVAVAQVRPAVGDSLVPVEYAVGIKKAVSVDQVVRPIRVVDWREHGELELVVVEAIEQLQAHADLAGATAFANERGIVASHSRIIAAVARRSEPARVGEKSFSIGIGPTPPPDLKASRRPARRLDILLDPPVRSRPGAGRWYFTDGDHQHPALRPMRDGLADEVEVVVEGSATSPGPSK